MNGGVEQMRRWLELREAVKTLIAFSGEAGEAGGAGEAIDRLFACKCSVKRPLLVMLLMAHQRSQASALSLWFTQKRHNFEQPPQNTLSHPTLPQRRAQPYTQNPPLFPYRKRPFFSENTKYKIQNDE